MLCAFFKQGQCTKGDKCKFSHDLTLERKAEKRSLYCDMRDDENDTMENWDVAKLQEVVEKKHGESEKKMPSTEIVIIQNHFNLIIYFQIKQINYNVLFIKNCRYASSSLKP